MICESYIIMAQLHVKRLHMLTLFMKLMWLQGMGVGLEDTQCLRALPPDKNLIMAMWPGSLAPTLL